MTNNNIPFIYISGRLRADTHTEIEANIRFAETVSLSLTKAGAAVHCPHTQQRAFYDAIGSDLFLEQDFAIIKRCDAIYMLHGWEESEGAMAELEVARENDVHQLLGDVTDACCWIRMRRAQ